MEQIETPEGEIVTPPIIETPLRTAEPEPEPEPEGDEPEPKKRTILDDLKDEREARKSLAGQVAQLQTQADLAPRLQAQLASMQAELERLKPKVPDVPEIPDAEAEATATRYGLYSLDGKPDLKAGRAIEADLRSRTNTAARALVEAEVAPLRKMTIADKAEHLSTAAIAQVTADKSCTPETLRQVLSGISDDQKANPDVVNAAIVLATGIDARLGKTPNRQAAPLEPKAPLFTEASGGRRLAPGPLSDLEKRAAKHAGMTDEDWKKSTANFDSSRSTRLE